MLFFAERKERKEAASVPLDRLCGWQQFGGGYKRRHPRSLRSRDPRAAAIFANIAPEGAHTARALRLRALCELCEHCNTFRAVGIHFPAEA